MHNPVDTGENQTAATGALTAAELFVLARIYAWDVRAWRPKTERRTALVVLDDPGQSSVNPKVVTRLLNAGYIREESDTLVVTATGVEALLKRPEMMVRMRTSGAI